MGDSHDRADRLCLNCGATVVHDFCGACGQPAHLHRNLMGLVHDIAHGVFHFEGRIWRTLPMLAWRPGELTRRYVHGERARFVSPMALFLFSVFLMFVLIAHLPGLYVGENARFLDGGVQGGLHDIGRRIDDQRKQDISAIRQLDGKLARLDREAPRDDEAISETTGQLNEARDAAARLAKAQQAIGNTHGSDLEATSSSWLNEHVRHATENPALLLYKLKMSAYKFSWALIPISLPFLWLLMPLRRDVGVYDHAIFAIYSLSFMSLLFVVLMLLGWLGVSAPILWLVAVTVGPVHMFRQLKGAYDLGRWSALWKTLWLLVFTLASAMLFMFLLLFLGVTD